MPIPKTKASQYQNMFQKNTESAQEQKLFIEALIKKLNGKLEQNPQLVVKAARIIEDWIKRPPLRKK